MSTADGHAMLTITEAAEAVGVERGHIRRRLDAGEFPNAAKEGRGAGRWLIPLGDLHAARLPIRTPALAAPSKAVVPVLSEVDALRAQVMALRIRLEIAETEARERDRIIAAKDDDLASLRAILSARPVAPLGTPVPPQSAPPSVGAEPGAEHPAPVAPTALNSLWLESHVEPEPPRRRWWRAPAPTATTLDSFWLTDEPVEPEPSPRRRWRVHRWAHRPDRWQGRWWHGSRWPAAWHRSDQRA